MTDKHPLARALRIAVQSYPDTNALDQGNFGYGTPIDYAQKPLTPGEQYDYRLLHGIGALGQYYPGNRLAAFEDRRGEKMNPLSRLLSSLSMNRMANEYELIYRGENKPPPPPVPYDPGNGIAYGPTDTHWPLK